MKSLVKTRYGMMQTLNADSVVSQSLRLYGEWAQKEIDSLSVFIGPGARVIDIGAYIGTHTLAFASIVGPTGSVHAFEPQPNIFELLKANVESNNLINVTLYGLALSDEINEISFVEEDIGSPGNFGATTILQEGNLSAAPQVSIILNRLDNLINGRVDLIKVDVEGMEVEVLKGAEKTILENRPIILCEVNSVESGVKLIRHVREIDYLAYGLLVDAYDPDNFLHNNQNIFGDAKEFGLVLVPKERVETLLEKIRSLKLPLVRDADDLVLMLLAKPQYPDEVLCNRFTDLALADNAKYLNVVARLKNAAVWHDELQVRRGEVKSLDSEVLELRTRLRKEIEKKLESEKEIFLMDQEKKALQNNYLELQTAYAVLNEGYLGAEERASKLSSVLLERETFINEMVNSTTWKMTSIFRWAGSFGRKFLAGFSLVGVGGLSRSKSRCPLKQATSEIVDVIVPVYRGLDETISCLESVWSSNSKTAYRLIVINDCSPEPEISEWLRIAAKSHKLILLENEENLGFVATVNKGMDYSRTNDVLLLNSDTEVSGDWLDRIRAAAYADNDIATVTPFSNNATICSYPKYCQDNDLPSDFSVQELDRIFSNENSLQVVEIPTAVGFCMYIRRECLDVLGLFNLEAFGKGYGEENDFCMRVKRAGWRNVLACDVFVWHKGSVSFGDSNNERKTNALKKLLDIYPEYDGLVQSHIIRDPEAPFRSKVSLARIDQTSLPKILFISHQRGGGTEVHCRELRDLLKDKALIFMLRPERADQVTLEWFDERESLRFWFDIPSDTAALISKVRELNINRVHIHHTIDFPIKILDFVRQLELPWDFTSHDYYSVCPQITLTLRNNRYCGELGPQQCQRCLEERPALIGSSIDEWREYHRPIIEQAERVFCPSEDTSIRFRKYFPNANIICAYHPDAESLGHFDSPKPLSVDSGDRLRVGVIGALSPEKGAEILELTAQYSDEHNLAIDFCLFGYAFRPLQTLPNLEVTGRYENKDLNAMISRFAPHIIWFPCQWPETYSYTLSVCIELGIPVATTNLGAVAERVSQRNNSWILDWRSSPSQWASFFDSLLTGKAQSTSGSFLSAPSFEYSAQYLTTSVGYANPPPKNALNSFAMNDYLKPRLPSTRNNKLKAGIFLQHCWRRIKGRRYVRGITYLVPLPIKKFIRVWLMGHSQIEN